MKSVTSHSSESLRRVFIRSDATGFIGGGHIVRCIALAQELKARGWQVDFLTSAITLKLFPQLDSLGFGVEITAVKNESDEIKLYKGVDLLIIDHYDITSQYEAMAAKEVKRLLVIDELGDKRHVCDMLIDQTLGRIEDDYVDLVPRETLLRIGPKFALLRPKFFALREDARFKRSLETEIQRVVINFGATDGKSLSPLAVRALVKSGLRVPVDIIIGGSARSLNELENMVSSMPFPIKVHVDAPNVAELLLAADIGIGASGVGALERCSLGLPSISVVTAMNQSQQALALSDAGATLNAGCWREITEESLRAMIYKITQDPSMRSEMSIKCMAICDGKGVNRIAQEIDLWT